MRLIAALSCHAALLSLGCLSADADSIRFLAEDAQVACRAILPQCFRKSDWADLCLEDPDIQNAHPKACAAAQVN